jgi:hypothetical protein
MTNMRTALQWLLEHELADDAEVWVLSKPYFEPVVALEPVGSDAWVGSVPVALDGPAGMRWSEFYGKLASWYTAAGSFRWAQHPEMIYRGSLAVNAQSAVFLVFLDPNVELVQSHAELMDQRRDQANKLTQEIEHAWQG